MKFSVLSSGSKANSIYVENSDKTGAVLVDCGLSGRQIKERLKKVGGNLDLVKAILVTHEHHDHIAGLHTIARQIKVPIFATYGTTSHFYNTLEHVHSLHDEVSFCIPGGFEISNFPTSHDATQSAGYVLRENSLKLGICTDLGVVTDNVRMALFGLDAVILESNHDIDKLWACSYPWELKNRIFSKKGHLSNVEASNLAASIHHEGLKTIVLGHISENSNTPELAVEQLRKELIRAIGSERDLPNILAASVAYPTSLICIKEPNIDEQFNLQLKVA